MRLIKRITRSEFANSIIRHESQKHVRENVKGFQVGPEMQDHDHELLQFWNN